MRMQPLQAETRPTHKDCWLGAQFLNFVDAESEEEHAHQAALMQFPDTWKLCENQRLKCSICGFSQFGGVAQDRLVDALQAGAPLPGMLRRGARTCLRWLNEWRRRISKRIRSLAPPRREVRRF